MQSGIRGVLLTVLLSMAACAPQATSSPTTGAASSPPIKKHITAGAMGTIANINSVLAISGSGNNAPGTAEVEQLLNDGLSVPRADGSPEAQLADAVPTVENDLWKVLPDGRMETTWHLRPGILWQDGQPFTADDLVFTAQLGLDRDLAYGHPPIYKFVEGVEAPDPNTVLVRWKEPYIEADAMFGAAGTKPAPKHLLEAPYMENKSTFLSVPFWSSGFIGTGPFRMQEWQQDSFVVLAANDSYVFGRPKIDEIEVRMIPDRGALAASILAGATETVFGRSLNPEEAVEVGRQWQDGTLGSWPSNPNIATPQHLNPDPPIVGNVQFRRALYTAIDRQELANIFTAGFGTAANSGVLPGDPLFDYVEAHVVHYPYDPQRAAQMIESLGYSKGADGMFQDSSGRPLSFELRPLETDKEIATSIADYWRRAGVATDLLVIPPARQSDTEWRATFPAFDMGGNFGVGNNLRSVTSDELRTPDNNYQAQNRGGYVNAALDDLVHRYYVTIPFSERQVIAGQIQQHITDQIVTMFLYYNTNPAFIANRLANITLPYFGNAQLWDVK